jgi:hypothetical protein
MAASLSSRRPGSAKCFRVDAKGTPGVRRVAEGLDTTIAPHSTALFRRGSDVIIRLMKKANLAAFAAEPWQNVDAALGQIGNVVPGRLFLQGIGAALAKVNVRP